MDQLVCEFTGTKKSSPAVWGSIVAPVLNSDLSGLARIFESWRQDGPPDSVTVAGELVAALGVSSRMRRIVLAAAELAAEPNPHPHHNNRHFLEVFAVTALLGRWAVQRGMLPPERLGLLAAAALVHDYRHDGTANNGQQFRLERQALEKAEPALRAAGAGDDDLAIIRAYVLPTDVSRNFADPGTLSPADSLKTYSVTKNPADLFPDLALLHTKGLADEALMLEDADLGAGMLSVSLFEETNRLVAKESCQPCTQAGKVFFLDQICHRRFFSRAGQALMQPCLDRVLRHVGLDAPPVGGAHPDIG